MGLGHQYQIQIHMRCGFHAAAMDHRMLPKHLIGPTRIARLRIQGRVALEVGLYFEDSMLAELIHNGNGRMYEDAEVGQPMVDIYGISVG